VNAQHGNKTVVDYKIVIDTILYANITETSHKSLHAEGALIVTLKKYVVCSVVIESCVISQLLKC